MAFCSNCGTRLKGGALFCQECGQKVAARAVEVSADGFVTEEVEPTVKKLAQEYVNPYCEEDDDEDYNYDDERKFNFLPFVIGGGVVIGVALIALVVFFLKITIIPLEDYVEVSVAGSNGCGEANVYIDENRLFEDYPKLNINDFYASTGDISFAISKDQGLSNGDIVEVEIGYDNKSAMKKGLMFKGDSIKARIEGLSETGSAMPSTGDETVIGDSDDIANSEYILPNSGTTYLTKADLAGLSKDELRIARNEIYARHGRMFSDDSLQNYFLSKSWYTPQYSADSFSDSMLSDLEIANRDLIVEYEKEMGYR